MPFGEIAREPYDLIVVGTGFAGTFFLSRYLGTAPPNARIAVIERGSFRDHPTLIEQRKAHAEDYLNHYRTTGDPDKTWMFTLGFGGGSNCWWGNVPRFLPADFEMRTRFGVGSDWPIGYRDLAPYYDRVEQMMSISGPVEPGRAPGRPPYPQPPHHMTDPERLLKAAYPDMFFSMPTARARIATAGRGVCCGNGVCQMCPVDAKFTILNGMMHVYADPRVTVMVDAEVRDVDHAAGVATGVRFMHKGAEKRATGDIVVVAANALFNPVILAQSGLEHPLLGRRLHEQVGLGADAYLDGVEGFQGSTSVTGIGYMLYDDDKRRREKAGCLLETWNVANLRTEFGKWRQVMPLRLVFDAVPDEQNHVALDPQNPNRPIMHYAGHGDYTERAIATAQSDLERILAPLPIESIRLRRKIERTEAHIIGTTAMGNDPASSIVDRNCVHHKLRNLLVLGSSTFPVGSPANPTLTIAAKSMRAADMLRA